MPPANDQAANAILITLPDTVSVSTVGSVTGGSWPDDTYPNVFYRIEPAADVLLGIACSQTGGMASFPEVDIYTLVGSDPPTSWADLDQPYDYCGDGTSTPSGWQTSVPHQWFKLQAGEVYFLDCTEYNYVDDIEFDMVLTTSPPLANDDWEDATVINQSGGNELNGTNVDATIQYDTLTFEEWEDWSSPSVWYRIECPDNGLAQLSVLNVSGYRVETGYRFSCDVYQPTTTTPANLDDIFNGTQVAQINDNGPFSAQEPYQPFGGWEPWYTEWPCAAGDVFYVYVTNNAVDPPPFGVDEVTGTFTLRVTLQEFTVVDADDGINGGSATTSIVDTDWVRDTQYRSYTTNEDYKGDFDYTKTFEVEPGLSGKYHIEVYARGYGGTVDSNRSGFACVVEQNGQPARIQTNLFFTNDDTPEWVELSHDYNMWESDTARYDDGGDFPGTGGPRFYNLAPGDVLSFHAGTWNESQFVSGSGGTMQEPPDAYIEIQKVRFTPAGGYDPLPAFKISPAQAEMWGIADFSRLATRSVGDKIYLFDDAYTTHASDNPTYPPTVFEKALGVWVYELVDGRPVKVDDDDLNLGASGGAVHDLTQQDYTPVIFGGDGGEVVMKDLTVLADDDIYCVWTENVGSGAIFTGDWWMYLAHWDGASWTIISDDVTGAGAPVVDYFPTDVSIDNDGEDVFIAWGENRSAPPSADGWWWKCRKYDVSGDTFTDLGSGQTSFPGAIGGTIEGDYGYPVRLKVSPGGVPWVVGITVDPDAPTFPTNYSEEYCFAWYWNGSSWIDAEIAHPSLVPDDVHVSSGFAAGTLPMSVDPQPGNYIAFAVYNLYYTDLTFCHHDGPNEWPAVMHQFVYVGGGPGDLSGFAYFECNGIGDWDNELFIIEGREATGAGPAGVVGLGRDYPTRFVSATSDYDGNQYIPFLGGWTQGWKLENDGSTPFWMTQKGYFGSGVDHVYVAKINPDGESVTLLGPDFPTQMVNSHWLGYQWIDPTSDAGCMVNGTPVLIWREVYTWNSGYVLAAWGAAGGAVSMNWRSSDRRGSADRVLLGQR